MQKAQLLFVVGEADLYTDPKQAWSHLDFGKTLYAYALVDGNLQEINYLSAADATTYEEFYEKMILTSRIQALDRTIWWAQQEKARLESLSTAPKQGENDKRE